MLALSQVELGQRKRLSSQRNIPPNAPRETFWVPCEVGIRLAIERGTWGEAGGLVIHAGACVDEVEMHSSQRLV